MKNQDIDISLLVKLREGDKEVFSLIFDSFYKYLYVLAYRYLMSEEHAEDAVQHTFMRLWENKEKYNYSKGIKNLLFTILKHYVLNEIRHKNLIIQKQFELAQMNDEVEKSFLKELEDKDFQSHFYSLIQQLPPQKRKVCMLKIEKGMTNQEIADKMKISVPTVKSHYTYAIKFLRMNIHKIMMFIYLINQIDKI